MHYVISKDDLYFVANNKQEANLFIYKLANNKKQITYRNSPFNNSKKAGCKCIVINSKEAKTILKYLGKGGKGVNISLYINKLREKDYLKE